MSTVAHPTAQPDYPKPQTVTVCAQAVQPQSGGPACPESESEPLQLQTQLSQSVNLQLHKSTQLSNPPHSPLSSTLPGWGHVLAASWAPVHPPWAPTGGQ